MASPSDLLTIGQTATRAGVASSALRFYEQVGLIQSDRNSGNQRRYKRAVLRRISLIKVAQTLGFTLQEIGEALAALPADRTPTRRDWERLSNKWRQTLDERIHGMQQLRDQLSACIGCGCLSLRRCALYNPKDKAGTQGSGPQYLLNQPGQSATQ